MRLQEQKKNLHDRGDLVNEIIKVDFDSQTVSARELYAELEVTDRFSRWFERMLAYGFTENEDFTSVKCSTVVNNGAERELQDYSLSVDMAKHICMVQKTERAKQVRQYLIDLEKAWNTPEQVMARALKIAQQTIDSLQPKADYFDALVDRNLLTNFTDTAKELGIKRKDFIKWLLGKGYCYRDAKGDIKPYAQFSNTATDKQKYFELKEWQRDSTAGTQTLVTPRGREAFRLMY